MTKLAGRTVRLLLPNICAAYGTSSFANWDTRADFFAKLEVMKWLVFEVLEDQIQSMQYRWNVRI